MFWHGILSTGHPPRHDSVKNKNVVAVLVCSHVCLRISYTEHVTNDEVLRRVGQDRALQGHVKSHKLIRACNKAQQPRKRCHARHHAGHEETRWSKETVAKQHNTVVRDGPGGHSPPGRRQNVKHISVSYSAPPTLVYWARQTPVSVPYSLLTPKQQEI